MNGFLTGSNKVLVPIGILGLIVLASLLVIVPSGCGKRARKAEQPKTKAASSRTTNTPRPTTAVPDPSDVDLSKYLSSDEKLLAKLFADVNKDSNKEIIFLSGKPWDINVQDPYLGTMRILTWDGSKYVLSWEQKTMGERSTSLTVEDTNKDTIVEILSYQNVGNALHLYVVAWNGTSYELLKPVGGNLGSKNAFGPKGAKVKDDDNDGVKEIYGFYGVAGSQADIYKWDGKNYTYLRTISIER